MKPPTIDREIRARIESFLTELTDLVRQSALDALHGALGTGAVVTVTVPTAAAAPKAARRTKRIKRTSEDVLKTAAVVHAYIKAHQGHSVEQIGKALGMKTKDLTLPIAKLIAQKAVKTKGERRGTRYFGR